MTLKMPKTKDGYAVKVMNWDSLDKMNPIGKTHSIKVSDIEDLSDEDTSSEEITSSDEYIDISELTSYDSNTYRVYNSDGTYESVKAENGKVHNTSKSEVTVVPEYKFEFTNTSSYILLPFLQTVHIFPEGFERHLLVQLKISEVL